jgi:uncharacterized membrane protein
VLRTFTDNRATQVVLGIFIATFTYSLLVLRGVRSEMDEVTRFVPGVSITMAVLLTLASIGALIFFVNHIARSIRVEAVMDRITKDVLERIDVLFPRDPASADSRQDSSPREEPGEISFPIRASMGGYLQHVEDDQLLNLTKNHDLILQMAVPVGTFLLEGDHLAFVSAREAVDESTAKRIRETFHIGSERTLYQDVVRGTVELTDIALRALSPSLNDPTTAIGAIDHLTRILHRLAGRRFPSPNRKDENGRLRVIAALRTFDEMVRAPLSQLRHAGSGHPSVAHRLIHAITRVAEAAPPDRIPPLLAEMEALAQSIRDETTNPLDLSRLEKEARTAAVAIRRRLIAAEAGQRGPVDRSGMEPGAP